MFNLRRDPFERALENSNTYFDWMMSHAFLLYEMQAIVAGQIEDFASSRRVRSRLRSTSTPSCRSWRTPAAAPATSR